MSDFFVLAVLYARSREEGQLRADLTEVVGPSRKDEGNLRYELFVDQNDPRRFVFFGHWASQASQEQHHAKGAHILRFHSHGISAVEKSEVIYKLGRIA